MKAGHVFTIEPMINLGSYADKTWGDNWTAVTSDGKRSAQFEREFLCCCGRVLQLLCLFVSRHKAKLCFFWFSQDTLLVTETGYELLTGRKDEPVMTWSEDLINR